MHHKLLGIGRSVNNKRACPLFFSRCQHESAGKKKGSGNKKIGNAHLRWAFAEAVCLWIRQSDRAKAWMKRQEKKRSKGKALSILGAKLARAMYHMLRKKEDFDEAKVLGG